MFSVHSDTWDEEIPNHPERVTNSKHLILNIIGIKLNTHHDKKIK